MNYLAKIKENWISILLVTLVVVGLSVIVTLIQKPEYRSSFSLLVIEKDPNLDAYAAAKSAERLSLSLGQVIYTTSFYDKVFNSGYLSSDFSFPEDEEARRQEWKKQIETRVLADVGMVKVSVYNTEPERATELAKALAIVLSENGVEYVGGGNSIVLKVVDYPFTENDPARPNIPMNIIAGLLIGFGGSAGFHIYQGFREQGRGNSRVSRDGEPTNGSGGLQDQSQADKNDYIVENYIPNKNNVDDIEEIPGRKNMSNRVRVVSDDRNKINTLHDHINNAGELNKGKSVWNGPEEEFRNFE